MKVRKYSEMERLTREIGEGSVLAAAGPDLYQSDRLQSIALTRTREELGFEVVRFHGGDLAAGDLKSSLQAKSLFSSGQLIMVSAAHGMKTAAQKELLDALKQGIQGAAVFITSERLPRESSVLRKVQKLIPFYICYEPFEKDMSSWAHKLAAEEDVTLERGTVQLLIQYSGRNLQRLADAVTKLALYHGSGAKIGREEMMKVLAGTGDGDVFELGDMIFENRRGKAIDSAAGLLNRGEEAVAIVSYLWGQWEKVTKATEVVRRGGGKKEVSAATGARYFQLDKLMKLSRTACKVDTAVAANAFAHADRGLKTGEDPMVVLSSLIFTLTNGG
ncbi:MAG: DNA polymerase III subunit delta [Candidatus Aegiribacteria sp.]|nr:DNA polymerase III subunit delta [Candidatus Aegiribacteria sp.]MBD3294167.1 DNA polymerase III subunit delta [Candidatus Fermentibacteria bacterium]